MTPNKLPYSAYLYYEQMFNKQKDFKVKKNYQACISWKSLSTSEREKFYTQYNEYKKKFKVDYLNEAEPFMKKIKPLKSTDIHSDSSNQQSKEAVESSISVEPVTSVINEAENITPEAGSVSPVPPDQPEHPMSCTADNPLDNESQMDTFIHTEEDDQQSQMQFLSEPAPPSVKSGRDLFRMFHSVDEEKSNTWASLPQHEKRRYGRAVFLLKKDYITKYKQYLESLPPRELFDHYNKTLKI